MRQYWYYNDKKERTAEVIVDDFENAFIYFSTGAEAVLEYKDAKKQLKKLGYKIGN